MITTYTGFGDIDQATHTRIHKLIEEYLWNTAYSSRDALILITVKSTEVKGKTQFSVTLRFTVNGNVLYRTKAVSYTQESATQEVFDYFEEGLLFLIAEQDVLEKGEDDKFAVLG